MQKEFTSPDCQLMIEATQLSDPLNALDTLSDLYTKKCYLETVALGQWLQRRYRDKSYSVSAEFASILFPEDFLSEYVLESYERIYLSALMAAAFSRLEKNESAAVELRRSYSESKAILYNFGDDPITALLIAAIWEKLQSVNDSRPFWSSLQAYSREGEPAHKFATERISEIDQSVPNKGPWHVYVVDHFPKLDWSLNFGGGSEGYYDITTERKMPENCQSKTGLLMNVEPWVRKVAARYKQDYHPLLNIKSWVRLPVGIAYGLSTFAVGTGVAVGGCALDASLEAKGIFCQGAVQAGGYLIAQSPRVVEFAIKPDLRHWRKMPGAILVTNAQSLHGEPCSQNQVTAGSTQFLEL